MALTCEPEIQNTTYLWWVNDQSLLVSPRLKLSNDNRTFTLPRVTRKDAGTYECEIRNLVSANHSDPVTLNVLCEYLLFLCSPGCQPKSTWPDARPLSPSQVQVQRPLLLGTQAGHDFLPRANLGRPSLDHESKGRGCSCHGRPQGPQLVMGETGEFSDSGSVATAGVWLGLQGCDLAQRDTVALPQTRSFSSPLMT